MNDLLSALYLFFQDLRKDINNEHGISNRLSNIIYNYYSLLRKSGRYDPSITAQNFAAIIQELNLPVPAEFMNILRSSEIIHDVDSMQDTHQRDHYFHSMHTFTLGLFILATANKTKILFTKYGQNVCKQWAFCALFHDLGYISQKKGQRYKADISEIYQKLCNNRFILSCFLGDCYSVSIDEAINNNPREIDELCDIPRRLLKSILHPDQLGIPSDYPSLNINNHEDNHINELFNSKNHGKISQFLLGLCRSIGESILKKDKQILLDARIGIPVNENIWDDYRDCIDAIGEHSVDDIHKIDLRNRKINPFIEFLYIVDNMQEYNRPHLVNISDGFSDLDDKNILEMRNIQIEVVDEWLEFTFPHLTAERIKNKVEAISSKYGIKIL